MNLMFWKKKTGAGEEAENARENLAVNTRPQEPLDFATTTQGIAKHNPESPEPETPAKPDDTATIEPDSESPDIETSAKLGLAVRVKLGLIALARRFMKMPAPDAKEDHAGKTDEPTAPEMPAKPRLLMRVKAGFAAFAREFKAPTVPDAVEGEDEDADSHGRSKTMPEDAYLEEMSGAKPVRSKKRLVIGGAIGMLILLLVGIGVAIWPALTPPEKRWGTRHDITTITSRHSQPESAPKEPQTSTPEKSQSEVEALKKENAELQARIEMLKKEPSQQQSYVPSVLQAGENAPSSSVSGELMVSNKNPKATAMTLKEAIEAMNASSGDHGKNPPNK